MTCLEPVEKGLLKNKPKYPNITPILFSNSSTQYTYTLHTKPSRKLINKSTSNGQSDAFAPSRTMLSLDPKHIHIQWSSDNSLAHKFLALRHPWGIFQSFTSLFQNAVFRRAIDDMSMAISIVPKTSYISDQDMGCQMSSDDEEAHKAYIWLMDLRFPCLISKLIEIINQALKSEN